MVTKIIALVSYVALLGWMAYFIVGGLPLLILKHEHHVDARFVRGFFDVHYLVLVSIAMIGALSSALSERILMALAIGAIGLIGFTARHLLLARMDQLRSSMTALDAMAKKQFRKLQLTGIILTLGFFAVFFSAINLSSHAIVTCRDVPPGCKDGECRVQCSLL